MMRFPSLVACVAVAALVVGCSREEASPVDRGEASPKEAPAVVVGTIDGQPVTESELATFVLDQRGLEAFHDLATERLVEARAKALGIVLDEAELAQVTARRRNLELRRMGLTANVDLNTVLGAGRGDELTARIARESRLFLLGRELAAAEVVADENVLRGRFESVYGPNGRRDKISQILFATDLSRASGYSHEEHAAELDEVKARLETLATSIRDRARGGEKLADLATEHGDDRGGTRRGDGDLGTNWKSRFGAEFDAAVEALEVGGVSDVLKTKRGYHVVEVYGIEEAVELELRAIRVGFGVDDGTPLDARQKRALVTAQAAALAARDDFAAAARRFSTDPRTQTNGGQLPLGRYESYGPAAAQVLRGLESGQVSEPVLVGREWFVFELVKTHRRAEQDTKQVRQVFLSWLYPAERRRRLGGSVDSDALKRATDAKARIDGGESFDVVLADLTTDGSITGGPVADYRPGRLGPDLEAALEELSVGGVSSPVKTSAGYVLVRVDERSETKFEDVREMLARDLARRGVSDDAVTSHLTKMRGEAKAEYTR